MGLRYPTFLSPEGIVISRDAWKEQMKENPKAYIMREFDDGRIYACLRIADKIRNAQDIPKEYWKVFEIQVENILTEDYEGNPLPKPKRVIDVDATRGYYNREDAIKAYDDFLEDYTKSFRDESGALVEEGNTLAPVIPPDPDAPTHVEDPEVEEAAGSW